MSIVAHNRHREKIGNDTWQAHCILDTNDSRVDRNVVDNKALKAQSEIEVVSVPAQSMQTNRSYLQPTKSSFEKARKS